jgi:rhamnulokinase
VRRAAAPLVPPGDALGRCCRRDDRDRPDPSTPVTAVGSHDTASAVVAVPMDSAAAAYVSLGTWGLVGVELDRPVLSEDGRRAGFTNELGVDGRTRFLKNVMGLWLLSECIRTWRAAGRPADLAALLGAAAELPAGGPVFDVADPRFLPPGDMPARVAAAVEERGDRPPRDEVAVVRCVVDSLAAALAEAVHDAARLSGVRCRWCTSSAVGRSTRCCASSRPTPSGLPVLAGPVEATALGNVLIQARAAGRLSGTLEDLRALVRSTHVLHTVEPRLRRSA